MTMGPCAIFVKEHFAKNSPKDLSEGKNTMREAAAAWKSLDEKYEELSRRYREKKINEFEALSDEEKKEMITASLQEREERARRRIRKARREVLPFYNKFFIYCFLRRARVA
uniref:HMG box domain-containing protein n=1 Tax=Angiostrongylus cantonensis TaxID=6313 RepID=A0A0K0DEX2_ANGCA